MKSRACASRRTLSSAARARRTARVTLDDSLNTDFDEALSFIKSSTAKMDRLINAVLKLSREGRRDFKPEEIDMNDLLASVTQNVAHRAAEMGAAIIAVANFRQP